MPIPANQQLDYEITIQGQIASAGSNARNTYNVFHYRRTTTVNPVLKSQLNTIFQTNIGLLFEACLNNRWQHLFNNIRCLNDANDAVNAFTINLPGGVAGDSMTTINAVYIKMATGLRGAHFRGSKHMGPLSEPDTSAGTSDILNAAAIARFAPLVTAMATPFVDAGGNQWQPIVFSRSLSQIEVNPCTVTSTDINGCLLNKRVGRLRRREVSSIY